MPGPEESESAFQRLSEVVRLRGLCRRCGEPFDVESPDLDTVGEVLRPLIGSKPDRVDVSTPLLLRTETAAMAGCEVLGGSFPYGVLFLDRALREGIDFTEGGEMFVDYAAL